MARTTYEAVLRSLKNLKQGEGERTFTLEEIEAQLATDFGDGMRPHRSDVIPLLTITLRDGHTIADAVSSVTRYSITQRGIECLERYKRG